jgi:hypothetical protein
MICTPSATTDDDCVASQSSRICTAVLIADVSTSILSNTPLSVALRLAVTVPSTVIVLPPSSMLITPVESLARVTLNAPDSAPPPVGASLPARLIFTFA